MSDMLVQWYNQACHDIEGAAKFICDTAVKTTQNVEKFVEEHYIYLKRRIIVLSGNCGGSEAAYSTARTIHIIEDVVKKTLRAAPFTAFSLFVPSYITLPTWIAFGVLHMVYGKPFSDSTYNNISMGLANASTIHAIQTAGELAATGNFLLTIPLLINLVVAASWYNRMTPEGRSPDVEDPAFDSDVNRSRDVLNAGDDESTEEDPTLTRRVDDGIPETTIEIDTPTS